MSRDAHFVRFPGDPQWWSASGPLQTFRSSCISGLPTCGVQAGNAGRHTSPKRQSRWSH